MISKTFIIGILAYMQQIFKHTHYSIDVMKILKNVGRWGGIGSQKGALVKVGILFMIDTQL